MHNVYSFPTVTSYKVSLIKFALGTRPPVSPDFGKQNALKATTLRGL
jgi:hypothetical protein